MPSPQLTTNIVESYNTTLSTSYYLPSLDAAYVFDNQALFELSKKYLADNSKQGSGYSGINRLIA
jgi:hypothetical protein